MKDFLIGWKEAAPAFGVIIAIFSAGIALIVLQYTKRANRRRATLDMVMKTLMDNYVQERAGAFKLVLKRDQDEADQFKIESLLALSSATSNERRDILHQLNVYELMALGIRRKVFDEAFYKRWYHNQFMSDYEGCLVLIRGLQDAKSTIFCECSWLYQKWLKHGHPESSPGRIRMAYWGFMKMNHKIDDARAEAKAR